MQNQIVTCGGMDCSVCSVLGTVNHIFRYLLDISTVLTILTLVIAGILYLLARGKKEELARARRTLFYGLYGFVVTAVTFVVVAATYLATGAKNHGDWFRIECTVINESNSSAQEPANIEDSSYLKNADDQIVESGSIGGITSGDKRIIKLDPSKMNSDDFEADIWSLDPERKISFFSGDKDVSGQEVVDFRNTELGFNQNKAENDFKIQPTENYTADQLIDPNGKVRPILTINTSDADDSFRVEWGEDLRKNKGNSMTTNKKGLSTIVSALKDVTQTAKLGGKDVFAFTAGDPSLVDNKYQNCTDSGGEMKEFQNACLADKEKYDNRDLECSKMYQPVTACDCPVGYYLKDEKCFDPATAGDRGTQKSGCKDISLEQKKCPVSPRCEGDQMMYYPESVKDQCLDSLQGPQVTKKYCEGSPATKASENKKCADELNSKSDQEKMKEAEDFFKKNGYMPDWYNKILEDKYSQGQDYDTNGRAKSPSSVGANPTGTTGSAGSTSSPSTGSSGGSRGPTGSTGGGSNTGNTAGNNTGGCSNCGNNTGGTGPTDSGSRPPDTGSKTPNDGALPQDQGSGNFNPTPTFKELKDCIGLKDDQIPYNGVLVALLNPSDPLNRKRDPNGRIAPSNSRMYYLSRKGEIIGKNGVDLGKNPILGGQEYGARTFHKGADNLSMWGRGWKIFKGPSIYCKKDGSWCDYNSSFGSQNGYKTGTSEDAMNTANLKGGKVTETWHCGQHSTESSAGCGTFGNSKSAEGFVKTAKSGMTMSNGTIMQVNLVGEMNTTSGKFSSPDCGHVDYCAAKRAFQNSNARVFRNDPNEGYDSNKEDDQKRMVQC